MRQHSSDTDIYRRLESARGYLANHIPCTGFCSLGLLRVVLSVRLRDGGLPFRFEYAAGTISRLAAECDAKKAARDAGLIVWAVIEICEG